MRERPTIPLSGVRNSWLMVAMNLVLSLLAFSAAFSALIRSVISRPNASNPKRSPS